MSSVCFAHWFSSLCTDLILYRRRVYLSRFRRYSASASNAWGEGSSGRLGNGGTSDATIPVLVSNVTTAIAVAAGDDYSLALLSDNTVMAWGNGSDGQLGNGANTNCLLPVPVPNLTNVVAIAACVPGTTDNPHSLALKSDGTVWAWGANGSYGRLGTGVAGGTTNRPVQVQFTNTVFITNICAGGTFSLAVNSNGLVYGWGNNDWGQLGDGRHANQGASEDLNYLHPVLVTNLHDIIGIAAGRSHSIVINTNIAPDGNTFSCGRHSWGQLGIGHFDYEPLPVAVSPNLTNAVNISAGESASYALLSNGEIRSWGNADRGRLGNKENLFVNGKSTNDHILSPTTVLYTDGSSVTNVQAIAAGANHALALLVDGTIVGWGENDFNHDVSNQHTNNMLGSTNIFGLRTNAAIQIPNISNVTAIAAGRTHSMALSNGYVYTWGSGYVGQLGNGTSGNSAKSTNPVQVLTISGIAQMASSGGHCLALSSNTTVWAWGNGANGQLGNGGTANASSPVQVSSLTNVISISAGAYHSLALSSNEITGNQIWAWGLKDSGRLSLTGTGNQTLPVLVSNSAPYSLTNVTITTNISTSIITNICYGYDYYVTNSTNSTPPTVIVTNSIVYTNYPISTNYFTNVCTVYTYTTNITTNTLLSAVKSVAAGFANSLALTTDGCVFVWGSNSRGASGINGELTDSNTIPVLVQNPENTGPLTNVVAIGTSRFDGDYTDIGIPTVFCHTIAVLKDGSVVAWGDAKEGQLGNGNTGYKAIPTLVIPPCETP